MSTFQIGDIVVGNSGWLNSLIGYNGSAGVLIHISLYSSIIHLFTTDEQITLMNEYIDKLDITAETEKLKIGDLVELHPKIKKF